MSPDEWGKAFAQVAALEVGLDGLADDGAPTTDDDYDYDYDDDSPGGTAGAA